MHVCVSGARVLALAVAAAVVVALAVGIAVAVQHKGGTGPAGLGATATTSASPSASPTPSASRGDYADQVVHAGDTVRGSGQVLAVPGKPVRFCGGPQAAASRGGAAVGPEQQPTTCAGVDAIGVDLSATGLQNRTVDASGVIRGEAELTGLYSPGTLRVTTQTAPAPDRVAIGSTVPCPPPAGGWPTGASGENLDSSKASEYGTAHAGAVEFLAELRPSNDQVVMYVLTRADPASVTAGLRSAYGQRLCVEASKYTRAQVDSAQQAFTALMTQGGAGGQDGVWANGQTLGSDDQWEVEVSVDVVTDTLVSLAEQQPAGLVVFMPWLMLVR